MKNSASWVLWKWSKSLCRVGHGAGLSWAVTIIMKYMIYLQFYIYFTHKIEKLSVLAHGKHPVSWAPWKRSIVKLVL